MNRNGITLTTMAITITIMIILASIVISLSLGKSGLIDNAQLVKIEHMNKQIQEYVISNIEIQTQKNVANHIKEKTEEAIRILKYYNYVVVDENYPKVIPENGKYKIVLKYVILKNSGNKFLDKNIIIDPNIFTQSSNYNENIEY